jgi:hypothetical protein
MLHNQAVGFLAHFGRIIVKNPADTKASILEAIVVGQGMAQITGTNNGHIPLYMKIENLA